MPGHTPTAVLEQAWLINNQPHTARVWQAMYPQNIFSQLVPKVRKVLSFQIIPEQKYLIALALILNLFSIKPGDTIDHWLGFQGNLQVPTLVRKVNLKGFSAGFSLGQTIYRLLVDLSPQLTLCPGKFQLGAVAMPVPLLYDFRFHLHKGPWSASNPWNPLEVQAWLTRNKIARPTNVHYNRDEQCCFNPSTGEKEGVLASIGYKCVLIHNDERDYNIHFGNAGHSYGHLLPQLAELPPGDYSYKRIQLLVDCASPEDTLALALSTYALELGLETFHNFTFDLLQWQEEPVQNVEELLLRPAAFKQDSEFANESRQQFTQAISVIDHGFHHFSPASKQWLFSFIMPAIQARECKSDLSRTQKSNQLYGGIKMTCKWSHLRCELKFFSKAGQQGYSVKFTFREDNEWAVFLNQERQEKKGFHPGDFLKFDLYLSEDTEVCTTCFATITGKQLHPSQWDEATKKQTVRHSAVKEIFCLLQTSNTEQEISRIKELAESRDATTTAWWQNIALVTRLPTPLLLSKFLRLPAQHLAHLHADAAGTNGTDWSKGPRPKLGAAEKVFALLQLQSFRGEPVGQMPSEADENFPAKLHTFLLPCFGLEELAVEQILQQPPDRAHLLKLAHTHPWIVLHLYSPTLAAQLYRLLRTEDVTFATILIHLFHTSALGGITVPIQGIAGAGKTFTLAVITIIMALLVDVTTVWTAKQNAPLTEAAQHVLHFRPSEAFDQHRRFIRLLADGYTGKVTDMDVTFEKRKKFDWPQQRFMMLTSGIIASNIETCYELRNTLQQELDLLIVDEAQQYGQDDDALAIAYMSKESTDTLIVLIGDQEQPVGAAPLRTKQLVLRRLLKNQPGLRAPLLRFRPPFEYIANLVDFYKNNSAVPDEDIAATLPQVHTLGHFNLYALIKLRTTAGPNRALTNHERLGWEVWVDSRSPSVYEIPIKPTCLTPSPPIKIFFLLGKNTSSKKTLVQATWLRLAKSHWNIDY